MSGYDIQEILNMLDRYLAIEFVSTNTFECLNELSAKIDEDTALEDRKAVLNFFMRNATNPHLTNSDLLPTFAEIYSNVLSGENRQESLSSEEACSYTRAMFHKNKKFMQKATSEILLKAPYLAETFYDCMGEAPKESPNEIGVYCKMLEAVYFAAEPEMAFGIIKNIYENPGNEELQEKFYPYLSSIYKDPNKTALQPYIYALMRKGNARSADYYNNLKNALDKGADPREILEDIDRGIEKATDSRALLIAYAILGRDIPQKAPELKNRAQDIIRRALEKNPNNNRTTRRRADVYLENWSELRGGAIVGQRVAKSGQYPFGWKADIRINEERPCILCLGGDGTLDEKQANGYAGSVEKLLERNGLKGKADIYSAMYDFGYNEDEYMFGSDSKRSRSQMFKDYKHLIEIKGHLQPTTEDKNPKYVQDLYEKFLLPRISKNDGKERLDFMEARKNIRNLQIVAHCHGAYTALKMEELMQKKMKELGYSKSECEMLQKELLVVAQSPYCPLGVSKSTFISFCSAKDAELNHHNYFNDSVWEINQERSIKLSYFDEKKGNLFLVSDTGIGQYAPDEHNYWGLEAYEGLSKDMAVMLKMEGNTIVNGLRNTLEGRRGLPPVEDLVCDGFSDKMRFREIERNGRELYGKIAERSKMRAKAARMAKKYGEIEY